MKVMRCILKLIALAAAVVAVVCLVKNYRETIEDIFYTVVGKIKEKKEQLCDLVIPSEYEDFDDFELN